MRSYVRAVLLSSICLSRVSCSSSNDFMTVLDESEKCARASDPWPCLKKGGAKVVGTVLAYQGEIPLMGPYLTVVPDKTGRTSADEGRGAVAAAGERTPPSSVYSKFLDFVDSRTLRVSLPMSLVTWLVGATAPATSEGRGKKNKGAGVLMLGGMMMMTTLMSTAFGALALMAAKGLMTSILALMLSAMAVSKKSGGHGHARTTYEVINGAQGYHHASDYKLENGAVIADVDVSILNEKINLFEKCDFLIKIV